MNPKELSIVLFLFFGSLVFFAAMLHVFVLLSLGKIDNRKESSDYVVLWPKWLYIALGIIAVIGGVCVASVFAVHAADWEVYAQIGFMLGGVLLAVLMTCILYMLGLFLGGILAFCYFKTVDVFSRREEPEQLYYE